VLASQLFTASFLDFVELIQLRFSRPNWLTVQKLAKHAANCPDVNRAVVFEVANDQFWSSVPP
jgi:hypothetical protein